MSRVINESIENEIKIGLKDNQVKGHPFYSFKLPKFIKNENDEYVFVGNAFVSTIQEFNKYKKTYGEIAQQLTSYKRTVGSIYRYALNSLIADNTQYQHKNLIRNGKNNYNLLSKLSDGAFTIDAVKDNSAEKYKTTLSYLTKAAYKSKRLKPSAKLNDLMKQSTSPEKCGVSILPVMTDNGVVLNQSKHNNKIIEASFKTMAYLDALDIQNYLIGMTSDLEEAAANQIKAQINKLFKEARQLGEMVESSFENDLSTRLENLAIEFSDLIGIDLSLLNKQSDNASSNESEQIESQEDSFEVQEENANKNYEIPAKKKANINVNEVIIDGTYKTAPTLEDGKIVTKLTPDGLKFTIQLENEKLFIKTNNEEPEVSEFTGLSNE